jgi:hypothetical protein
LRFALRSLAPGEYARVWATTQESPGQPLMRRRPIVRRCRLASPVPEHTCPRY